MPRNESLMFSLGPPVEVALVRPQIAPNVGNAARTCAAFGVPLHLIGPLGFSLDDAALRRAGVDSWAQLEVHCHRHLDEVLKLTGGRAVAFTTDGDRLLSGFDFCVGDVLVFGTENTGLSADDLAGCEPQRVRIPHGDWVRSLNLSTCVGIGVYAALCGLRALPPSGG
ncbi:MAG: tRNA (uridine(34)/cytosine(34)/5-carboxymethylaminomethyluridine(34)-2'-O)-methyltransferase TrmL [Deltaproteobacteria bacterium]|nr:tRNA (uridine(34)/cytosine(34)/5-carboxymethylaminomethyluridine(34)-2'-O)-methyltransferase TrmL [Deltaproteobacteria bacterium]